MSENREFRIEATTEVEATPERVWEAINDATAAWMFPTDQWPAEYPVKEYPTHVISRMDGPDGWFNQLENTIEALPGGKSRIRYVHSGVFTDDWDQQYDGASKHTLFYQHTWGSTSSTSTVSPWSSQTSRAPPLPGLPMRSTSSRSPSGSSTRTPGKRST